MKIRLRDYLLIGMAFCTVLLSGYGIGHLVGQNRAHPAAPSPTPVPAWQAEALRSMERRLDLRPGQIAAVERELAHTAENVRRSHDKAAVEYLWHINHLHDRLIEILEPAQADILREEKWSLEEELRKRYPDHEHTDPH